MPAIRLLQDVLGPGADLHLVGGTVRDVLAGVRETDIDLATRLLPEHTSRLLTQAGIRVIETGIEHGTLTALIEGRNIEITTFRRPGARTTFRFSTHIEEDLRGRDFTINAMAYGLNSRSLIDPFDGAGDLSTGLLRTAGAAEERFMEDPHRILRLVRFGPAQGRRVDAAAVQAARALGRLLAETAVERVRSELEKILLAAHPKDAFVCIRDLDLLRWVLPEMLPAVGFEQNEFHIEDVFMHTLSVVERAPADRVLRLAALFHDLGKPHTLSVNSDGRRHFYKHEEVSERLAQEALERLRFSHDDIAAVRLLVAMHMRPLECGPSGVRRLIRDLGEEFSRWREFKIADATPTFDEADFTTSLTRFDHMVEEERNRVIGSPFGSLAVDGNDLIALGMQEGPAIGRMLRALNDLVIENPEANVRETLLDEARTRMGAA